MGNARSAPLVAESSGEVDEGGANLSGYLLFVALKMSKLDNQPLPMDLVPHVVGSLPMIGNWDEAKAIALERESANGWELSFVAPVEHGLLDFKFLLKRKGGGDLAILEEGATRILQGGTMAGAAGLAAQFRFPTKSGAFTVVQFPVTIQADPISPFALAASWRSLRKNLQSHGSMVMSIPDVIVDAKPEKLEQCHQSHSLELDLDHYEVPAPDAVASTVAQDPLDNAAEPSDLRQASLSVPFYGESKLYRIRGGDTSVAGSPLETPQRPACKDRCVSIKDLVVLGIESEAAGVESPEPATHSLADGIANGAANGTANGTANGIPNGTANGIENGAANGIANGAANRTANGVVNEIANGVRLASNVSVIDGDVHLDNVIETMPEAAGAVAAVAALADRVIGPKDRRQLAIILVGLPARGKTFTAAKLTRYLRWLGHDTKHFNVGKYRRLKLGSNQTADFFRGDNQEGIDARNEVAVLAMEDMLAWMYEGGQVGVFDATNSTKARRDLLLKLAEGRCKVIFLEIICNNRSVIETNIQLKTTRSPDYADMPDYETALEDFRTRLDHYDKMYEPVTEGSYIKLIDMVSGQGGHMQVNNISGYLPGRIVFFLVNTHLTPRPIFLTRHGESQDNVRGRIGGDPALSEAGEMYALKLADFVHKRLKNESAASVWTSTLQRTGITARHVNGFPKVAWRALDEINAGVCDGMTYEEIKESMPDEYKARKADKLRYRYPRGESYLDVIQRVEPVIVELERQRSPVVVIAHQAILRSLYAYFMDKPLQDVPHIQVPLHTIIEIQMGVTGMQEKRYKLMETTST